MEQQSCARTCACCLRTFFSADQGTLERMCSTKSAAVTGVTFHPRTINSSSSTFCKQRHTIDLSLCSITRQPRTKQGRRKRKRVCFSFLKARAIKQGVLLRACTQRMWGCEGALRKEEPQSSSGAAHTIRKGQETRPLGRRRVIISQQTQLSAPNFSTYALFCWLHRTAQFVLEIRLGA
jgi:hypothetical protein